jgi:hypothetical protein
VAQSVDLSSNPSTEKKKKERESKKEPIITSLPSTFYATLRLEMT